jgi:hypothetical protein
MQEDLAQAMQFSNFKGNEGGGENHQAENPHRGNDQLDV